MPETWSSWSTESPGAAFRRDTPLRGLRLSSPALGTLGGSAPRELVIMPALRSFIFESA